MRSYGRLPPKICLMTDLVVTYINIYFGPDLVRCVIILIQFNQITFISTFVMLQPQQVLTLFLRDH